MRFRPPPGRRGPLTLYPDDADQVRDTVLRTVRSHIARVGWGVIATPDPSPSGDRMLGYTVGLTESHGHPELVLTGLAPDLLQQLLNDLGKNIAAGERYADQSRVADLIAGYDVVLRAVAPASRYRLSVARAHYGDDGYTALQIVWPDPAGHFPWDREFDSAYRHHQPQLWSSHALPSHDQ